MTPSATGILAAAAALAVSPLLASWTAALVNDDRDRWWRPQRVSFKRWTVVAIVAAAFAAAGSHGAPRPAWWLLAATGAILAIVDAETYRLPARLVGPLAATEAVTLMITALVLDDLHPLIRAILAAVAVGGAYLLIAVIYPPAIGLGDVYVAAITAGMLGWTDWTHVILGQTASWLLGPIVMAAIAITRPHARSMTMSVPMGPALIVGALLASWL